jgi:hypothetical protein
MRRYLFFAAVFPLGAIMPIALGYAPTRWLAYTIVAGYVTQLVPAILIALTDEIAEFKDRWVRAGWCALAGFMLAPLPWLAFEYVKGGFNPNWRYSIFCAAGAVSAFLCSLTFQPLQRKRR